MGALNRLKQSDIDQFWSTEVAQEVKSETKEKKP